MAKRRERPKLIRRKRSRLKKSHDPLVHVTKKHVWVRDPITNRRIWILAPI
jgi:hypothetical protein